MSKITAYLSHHIRGPKGDQSTQEDRDNNREDAGVARQAIEWVHPKLNIYCPGEGDLWAGVAMRRGLLTIEQVLEIDCAIIDTMDCVLIYDRYNHMSGGMMVEKKHCCDTSKPFFYFRILNPATKVLLENFLTEVRRGKIQASNLGH